MSDITLTFAILAAVVALFIWNRIPVDLVAIGAALALFATGILTNNEALAGFGDPVVLFIAALFVVSEGLNASGVTVYGLDLNSFEDWTRMIVSNGRNIGLTAMFIPMWRIERITLDQTIDDLLSLQAQFELRVGVPVQHYIDAQFTPGSEDADSGSEM